MTNNWRSDVLDKAIFQVDTGNDQQLEVGCLGQGNIPGKNLDKLIYQVETSHEQQLEVGRLE